MGDDIATVIDVIELKESLEIALAPGVAVVLDSRPPADPQSFVGRRVLLRTPSGHYLPARIAAVRDHGTTISFFFPGLTGADVPIGTRIDLEGLDN